MKKKILAKIIAIIILCALACSLTSCIKILYGMVGTIDILEFVEVEGGYAVKGAIDSGESTGDFITKSLSYLKTLSENMILEIPSEHNGKPVVAIADEAFKFYVFLNQVIIPDTVKVIGESAFEGCILLMKCDIPESVTEIQRRAFIGCMTLKKIEIPDGVISIGEEAFVDAMSFSMGDYSKVPDILTKRIKFDLSEVCSTVKISKTVENIGSKAFGAMAMATEFEVDSENQYFSSVDGILCSKDGTKLIQYPAGKADESFTIPDYIAEIGPWAFHKNTNLKTLIIPNHIEKIGGSAFRYTSSDLILDFGEVDPSFEIIDGILYSSDGRDLVMCFNDTVEFEFVVPDSVVNIGEGAFYGCENLLKLTFGENSKLEVVGDEAFYNCAFIENIDFPKTIKSIGNRALANCEKLKSCGIYGSDVELGTMLWKWSWNLQGIYYGGDAYQFARYLNKEIPNYEIFPVCMINCSNGYISCSSSGCTVLPVSTQSE